MPTPAATPRPPLDAPALERLAVHYVGRYATTTGKLAAYLARKARERGWDDPAALPDAVAAVVARCVTMGYVDDAGFASARAAALVRRGYGPRRIAPALVHAGIARAMAAEHLPDDDAAHAAADAYARRRRFGPYARAAMDPDQQRRAIAAMMRAGHAPALARAFVETPPGAPAPLQSDA